MAQETAARQEHDEVVQEVSEQVQWPRQEEGVSLVHQCLMLVLMLLRGWIRKLVLPYPTSPTFSTKKCEAPNTLRFGN